MQRRLFCHKSRKIPDLRNEKLEKEDLFDTAQVDVGGYGCLWLHEGHRRLRQRVRLCRGAHENVSGFSRVIFKYLTGTAFVSQTPLTDRKKL